MAAQAWATFVRRWMYDTGLSATEVAAAMLSEWDGGAAAVLEGVGLAAGAMCLTAEGLPEADVSSLTSKLLMQAQSGRSSGITRSALVGAALAASRLHPTDWAARQQVLGELRAQLLAGTSAVVRSAAATALAVMAGSLAADPAIYIRTGGGADGGNGGGGADGGHHSRELLAVAEAVSCLIATLAALCPQLAAPLTALAAAGMPPGWPQDDDVASAGRRTAPRPLKDEVDEQEVLPGTAVALASLLCDVNRAHGMPAGALSDLVAALIQIAAAAGDGGGGSSGGGGGGAMAAAAVAALEAAATLAPEVMRYQQMSHLELKSVLQTARSLCGFAGGGGSGGGGGSAAAAAAVDGRVRGTAAYCLACVAVAALRQGMLTAELVSELGILTVPPPSVRPRPGSDDAAGAAGGGDAAAALTVLVSELSEQAGPAAAAPADTPAAAAAAVKGQHTAAARMGAVAGLAAVLLPPLASLVDALAPIPPGAIGAGLLAQPEHVTPAKAAVRALERLATEDTDPWVNAAAAFHLAAVSAAVDAAEEGDDDGVGPGGGGGGSVAAAAAAARTGGSAADDGSGAAAVAAGSGGGGGVAAGGPKPLSLYPPEGAVRPLVAALMDRSRLSAMPLGALADTLLALATAPALPAADWPTACRALLARAAAVTPGAADVATAAAGARLQAATLLLALTHGSVPSLGMGALLEELVAPARFAALPPAVQGLVLARLTALLRSLAAKRAAAVVQGLPGLLAAAAAPPPAAAAAATVAAWDFPWSSPAGLGDPPLQLQWLRRVRQSLPMAGPGCGGGASGDPRAGGGGSASGSGAVWWLAAHCWLGLLGLCRGWQAKDVALTHRDVTQAAHSAIAALASQLPALPPLQLGEAAQLMAWAAAPHGGTAGGGGSAAAAAAAAAGGDGWEAYGSCGRPLAAAAAEPAAAADCGGGGGGAAAARAAVTLWSLAACTMRCLRPDFLTAQVLADPAAAAAGAAPPSGRALAALQLRCVLVASGHVSYRELMPVRTAATAAAAAAAGDMYGGDSGDPLLAPLSLALAGTPQAFQVQVLLQTLDAARVAPQPGPALELAAALVAACLGCAAGAAAAAAPEMCVALSSRRAALECLPYALPRLLSRPPWSSSCEAVAQALLAVAREGLRREAEAEAMGAGKAGSVGGWVRAVAGSAKEGLGGATGGSPLGVVLACLWALRDVLPAYTYDQLHAALGWRTLARVVVDAVEA